MRQKLPSLANASEAEKWVEAVKKLPRKFPSLAESFWANHTRDVKLLTFYWDKLVFRQRLSFYLGILFSKYNSPICDVSNPYFQKCICNSFDFHVSD